MNRVALVFLVVLVPCLSFALAGDHYVFLVGVYQLNLAFFW